MIPRVTPEFVFDRFRFGFGFRFLGLGARTRKKKGFSGSSTEAVFPYMFYLIYMYVTHWKDHVTTTLASVYMRIRIYFPRGFKFGDMTHVMQRVSSRTVANKHAGKTGHGTGLSTGPPRTVAKPTVKKRVCRERRPEHRTRNGTGTERERTGTRTREMLVQHLRHSRLPSAFLAAGKTQLGLHKDHLLCGGSICIFEPPAKCI